MGTSGVTGAEAPAATATPAAWLNELCPRPDIIAYNLGTSQCDSINQRETAPF